MPDEVDPASIVESNKESVAKIREMTDDLRAVLDHEKRIAGDLLEQVPVNKSNP